MSEIEEEEEEVENRAEMNLQWLINSRVLFFWGDHVSKLDKRNEKRKYHLQKENRREVAPANPTDLRSRFN